MVSSRLILSRRSAILGAAAFGVARTSFLTARTPKSRIVASGLMAPESPKPLPDGTILLVEMVRKTLSRVDRHGGVSVVAAFPAAPNACAIGPDGAVYLTINAASVFRRVGQNYVWSGVQDPGLLSQIARVDLRNGHITTLYASQSDRHLVAPNDLVFDGSGGFYFTDTGASVASGPTGAVYYASADGAGMRRICDVPLANGVILSPDRSRLLVCSGKAIVEYGIEAPGELARDATGRAKQAVFAKSSGGMFDSMAGLADGGILAGGLHPGALVHFAPDGTLSETTPFAGEEAVTNVGIGGKDMRSAYVSLTETGRLVEIETVSAGLRLAY
jgi:gluconolactonase